MNPHKNLQNLFGLLSTGRIGATIGIHINLSTFQSMISKSRGKNFYEKNARKIDNKFLREIYYDGRFIPLIPEESSVFIRSVWFGGAESGQQIRLEEENNGEIIWGKNPEI